jgi:hypothetical protein
MDIWNSVCQWRRRFLVLWCPDSRTPSQSVHRNVISATVYISSTYTPTKEPLGLAHLHPHPSQRSNIYQSKSHRISGAVHFCMIQRSRHTARSLIRSLSVISPPTTPASHAALPSRPPTVCYKTIPFPSRAVRPLFPLCRSQLHAPVGTKSTIKSLSTPRSPARDGTQ